MVNGGVVDSCKHNDQVVLHFSSAIQAMKLNPSNQQENRPRYQDRSKERHQFSNLGDSYEDVLKKVIINKLVHPQDPARNYIPDVKPHWWDEKAFCKFHNGIGHDIEKC